MASARNTTGLVDPNDHGNGPVDISLSDFPSQLDDRVVQTAKTTAEFPFNIDFQSGNSVGVCKLPFVSYDFSRSQLSAPAQNTIGHGVRSNSATAYLEPALGRGNLDVLITNTVTRLIATGNVNGKPSFKKVEFAPSAQGTPSVRSEVLAHIDFWCQPLALRSPPEMKSSSLQDL